MYIIRPWVTLPARLHLPVLREVDAAVAVARDAFPAWASTPPVRRARVMFKFKALIEQNMDRLAEVVTEEHGKTIDECQGLDHPWARGG